MFPSREWQKLQCHRPTGGCCIQVDIRPMRTDENPADTIIEPTGRSGLPLLNLDESEIGQWDFHKMMLGAKSSHKHPHRTQ
jgi:hypothetical protein